ncbi:pyridoxal phosphate-dependent transferase [Chytridium lagenaria]|nr:pyridoxal phosphate-dependent transferase [Chytridium lagenaria]
MTVYDNGITPIASDASGKAPVHDFRSDTFTKPTEGMLKAMMEAEVGDDVFQEDPTVNRLQDYICEITGFEAALFCTSATMTNQLAVRCLLDSPPYSVLTDKRAHVYSYEAGGVSFHNGATVIPVDPGPLGYLTAESVAKNLILSDDKIHLERVGMPTSATGISLKEYLTGFDTATLCLSKGIGAPVGSVLIGSAATIKRARHFRKMFGGGWRKPVFSLPAALYALENHWPRLSVDHENARLLADGFEKMGFKLTKRCDTNMVWVEAGEVGVTAEELRVVLKEHGGVDFWWEDDRVENPNYTRA